MSSAAQALASRTNAQFSTGPVTEQGKAKMYANPLRHGLTAKSLILPGEKLEDFEALHRDMVEHFQPATPIEESLVAKLAESEWRLTRARRVETETLNYLMEQLVEVEGINPERALALVFLRHGKDIERLRRYETTIARAEAKQRAELDKLLQARYRMEMLNGPDESEQENSGESMETSASETEDSSVSQDAPQPSEPYRGCSSIPIQTRYVRP